MTTEPNNIDQDKDQEIHNKMSEAQQKLSLIEAEGQAKLDNHTVTVQLNGRYEATKVAIDPELLQQPVDNLNGLVAKAITDAAHKAETAIQHEMMRLFQDFKMPD